MGGLSIVALSLDDRPAHGNSNLLSGNSPCGQQPVNAPIYPVNVERCTSNLERMT
jgi:hypothetical protein